MITTTAHTFEPIPLPPLSENPLVSIIMSNFNYGHFIEEAIQSVLDQTYPHFEMIIADDGSTDDSVERILRFAQSDDRIKLLVGPNGGQASAWNRGFAKSKGSIVCFLDSDDLFAPEKIERIVNTFRHFPQMGLIVHPMLVIDEGGQVLRQIPPIPNFEHGWIGPRVLERRGRWNTMPSSALSIRREIGNVIFPMSEDFGATYADGFILRIAPLLTPITSREEPLALYRSHGQNVTNDTDRTLDPAYIQAIEERTFRTGEAINRRLQEVGLSDRLLVIRHNPRMIYWISLLDSSNFWRRLQTLIPLLIDATREDMELPAKKLAKGMVYSLALVLPRAQRAELMHRFFSFYSYQHGSRPWQTWSLRTVKKQCSTALKTAGQMIRKAPRRRHKLANHQGSV